MTKGGPTLRTVHDGVLLKPNPTEQVKGETKEMSPGKVKRMLQESFRYLLTVILK